MFGEGEVLALGLRFYAHFFHLPCYLWNDEIVGILFDLCPRAKVAKVTRSSNAQDQVRRLVRTEGRPNITNFTSSQILLKKTLYKKIYQIIYNST